jgi:trigger factor
MHVSVEIGEGLQRHVLVDIPAEPVKTAIDEKLKELASKVRIDGFRPGKVPVRIVKQRYYPAARQEVTNELLESSYREAIEQEKLQPAGNPIAVKEREATEKDGFSYTATIEVYPKVELQDLTGETLIECSSEITDIDIDNTIQTIREQNAKDETVEQPAEQGDTVHVDTTRQLEGEDTPQEDSHKQITLGSGHMIAGFEDGLIGARAGDERTLDLVIPDDHSDEEIAGKKAQYIVNIQKVTRSKLPELDEDFIKSLGIEDGTETRLRTETGDNLRIELSRKLRRIRKEEAFKLLATMNPFEVPTPLVENQAENLRDQLLDQWRIPPESRKNLGIDLKHFMKEAREQIHLGFLITAIVDEQKLQVSEDELREIAHEQAQSYQDPEKFIEASLREQEYRETLRNAVLEEKVTDWIYQQVNVEQKTVTFAELQKPTEAEETTENQDTTDA